MSRRALILSICVPFVAICPQIVHALAALKLEAGANADRNARAALMQLTSGLSSHQFLRQRQVFTLASNGPGFWELVAKASDPQPALGDVTLAGKRALFLAARQSIEAHYDDLVRLSVLDNNYQAGNNLQALWDLMDLDNGNLQVMQLYRACYAISPHDLFELVHAYVSSTP
jgi:hypothetical protein